MLGTPGLIAAPYVSSQRLILPELPDPVRGADEKLIGRANSLVDAATRIAAPPGRRPHVLAAVTTTENLAGFAGSVAAGPRRSSPAHGRSSSPSRSRPARAPDVRPRAAAFP